MRLNTEIIKRWIRSKTNKFFALLASAGPAFLALDPTSQGLIIKYATDYLAFIGLTPAQGISLTGTLIGIAGIWLRATTTKPLSER